MQNNIDMVLTTCDNIELIINTRINVSYASANFP